MNNKRFATMQHQQQYRPYAQQQGVGVQQGQGSVPRNTNPQQVRVQNGPRQSQTQQNQVLNHNQAHVGMTGVVPVSHSQHPHGGHGGSSNQGQPQHPQQQMQFAAYPAVNPGYYYPPFQYSSMQAAPQYLQYAGQQPRLIAPQQMQPSVYLYQPNAAHTLYQLQQQQNQHAMVHQQHQQSSAAAQHNQYYSSQQYATPTRLPMHGGTVHTAVVPVHSNVQQTTAQHTIPHQQVSQPLNNVAHMPPRNEGNSVPTTERKRNILKIVDPKTGANVIGDSDANTSTTTSDSAQLTPAEGKGDVVSVDSISQEPPPEVSADVASSAEDADPDKSEKSIRGASEEPQGPVDETKSKARAEFFQKITKASEDSAGNIASGTNNIQGAIVSPPSPIPASQVPEQPESPPIDSSKSQQAVLTPSAAANTSSDDSKDASLVSVSPVPLENYLTPQKTLLPEQGDEGSFEEEQVVKQVVTPQKDEPVSLTLDATNQETSLKLEVEVTDELPETQPFASTTASSVEAVGEEKGEVSVSAISETIFNEIGSEDEQASDLHQNGDLELEEGEIVAEDEETGAEESADDTEGIEKDIKQAKKEKIKYDRDFLLTIGEQTKQSKITGILADVIKDAHSRGSHHSPGSLRDQFMGGRMGGRGGPGPKQALGGMMGINYPGGNRHGGMGMGWAPMVVPPRPPPPKIIELSREQVKLHKADDAWKPGTIKHRSGHKAAPDDPEEAIIDDIVKKTRGILNKLTPENSSKLTGKFMSLPLENKEERISKVIKVVFDKAVDEPSFSKEYAKMVHTVCNNSVETAKKFRKQILDQCQQEFQKNNSEEGKIKQIEEQLAEAVDDKKEQLLTELEELKFQNRRRSLGNVRFIGELFKLQMLTAKIMVDCVGMLIGSSDEENLECLCKLLTTVGQKLEEQLRELETKAEIARNTKPKQDDKNAPKMPKFVPDPQWMSKTFARLKALSENFAFSSRIRFALLDVYELRENNWKPRRDANAPKTIDEVRRDAIKQEMEEKRQINNLPPPSSMDQRGSSRAGPPQLKKGDWSVQNKSSRFAIKKSDAPTLPVLAPPVTSGWGRSVSGGGAMHNKPPMPIAPRFNNRFQELSDDRLNPNQQHPPNSRDSMLQKQQPFPQPSYLSTSNRNSPIPSSNSSRENSRPVSPKEIISSNNNDKKFNVSVTVKNIFEEFCATGNFLDTLEWIKDRFPGENVVEFVDELSRKVGEMYKLTLQQQAGNLVRLLIKCNDVTLTKQSVLHTLSHGVMVDLPDIMIDVPMVTTYLAQFLVEIFHDDKNLDWLLALDEVLQGSEDYASTWNDFCCQSLILLRSRTNEDIVRTMFKNTKEQKRIPLVDLPWLCPEPESLAKQMVPVLKRCLDVNNQNQEEIRQALQENSWDIREELINVSLLEAICIISWNPDTKAWDQSVQKQLIPVLSLPTPKVSTIFKALWTQVCKFCERNDIDKAQKDILWGLLYELDIATSEVQPSD